jgi:RNA polymerase sigma-70 factor (ECF subfamily)
MFPDCFAGPGDETLHLPGETIDPGQETVFPRGALTATCALDTQPAERCATSARTPREMGMQHSIAITAPVAGHQPPAKEIPDQELIGLIAADDKSAMRILFGRHQVRVFRFLLRMVGNRETAEDLVNEVFLEVWRNAGQFEVRSQVTTWMLGIARHKALSLLRRHSMAGCGDEVLESIEDPSDNPEVTMQKSERGALLRDCIKQLSAAHREIIDLVYYHGRSVNDVAKIVGVPVNTVKTRMFYARKHIADMMAARGIERAWL